MSLAAYILLKSADSQRYHLPGTSTDQHRHLLAKFLKFEYSGDQFSFGGAANQFNVHHDQPVPIDPTDGEEANELVTALDEQIQKIKFAEWLTAEAAVAWFTVSDHSEPIYKGADELTISRKVYDGHWVYTFRTKGLTHIEGFETLAAQLSAESSLADTSNSGGGSSFIYPDPSTASDWASTAPYFKKVDEE